MTMTPNELNTWVLAVMQDELAARKANVVTSKRDMNGHPLQLFANSVLHRSE